MTVGREYARGNKAWGLCQRCGLRALLNDMVFDGRYAWLVVHPECYEPVHPQERLISVYDPVSLYRPSPESNNTVAPVLSVLPNGSSASLTWTAATTLGARIEGYIVLRSTDGITFTAIINLPITYSFIGEIEEETLAYEDSPGAGSYFYTIDAYDCYQRTYRSNVEEITLTSETPVTDDIFTLKALDHLNIIDTNGDVEIVNGQYGPAVLGGFNTLLFMDGETFDYAATTYCLAPGGLPLRVAITVQDPLPAEMEYLDFYIEGDTGVGFASEIVSFAVGEAGAKFTMNSYVNVQLVELQYQDYPVPTILVPATMILAVGFEVS